jgi:hypothetical protein
MMRWTWRCAGAPQPGASQPPGTNPVHADAGVLCWIMPPVLRALETAAAALGTPQADAAALDSAGESLRQAGGALALARVAGAAQVLASAAHLLAQPGASDADRLALCREACTEVRDYVSGLCEGQPQRPCALAGVQRALQSRAGLHTYADLDACFAEGLSLDGALEPAAAERVRGQRERLRRLEELWERCGAGDGDALPAFAAMLRELLAEGLPHPRLVALGAQVQQAVPAVVPERSAALAIATALLFLQDTLAVWPATGATLDSQVDALIQGLRGGAPAPRVDLQQERHRREQARALAARLSAELVGLLRSVQHHLQAFFEEAAPIDTLAPARSALAQTRQVQTLMGEDAAARATDYCTQRVGEWQFDAAQADTRRRTDVAATVCALEYYLEQLAFGEGDLGAILKRAGAPDALHAQRAAAEDALASGEPPRQRRWTSPPTRTCCRSSWKKLQRCSRRCARNWAGWAANRAARSAWRWCAAPITRSRAAAAWSASCTWAMPHGRWSRRSTTCSSAARAPVPNCCGC